MLVFKLPYLQDDMQRADCLRQLRTQLDSFAVHASSSPLLLVGTHKDAALTPGSDAQRVLSELDALLRRELKACPAFAKVVRHSDLCFFPIENTKGYAGDVALRQLVAAIQTSAEALPSMQQRVPVGWLAVYDRFAAQLAATPKREWLSFQEVVTIASTCGMPHDAARVSLEQEAKLMLGYLHSLGAIAW